MQKICAVLPVVLILTLVFFSQRVPVWSQKTARSAAPVAALYQCWNFNFEGLSKIPVESDNANQIFIAYQDGIVGAIDAADGNQNWKTELGGRIVSLTFQAGTLYVVSLNEDGAAWNLRALSAATGIAKWQRLLTVDDEQGFDASRISLIQADDFLYLVTGDGALYKFSGENGELLAKDDLGENVTTPAKLIDREIIAGTNKKTVIAYSISQKTTARTVLGGTPTILYADPQRIVVGDKSGKLSSFKIKSNKKEWAIRLGAEVSDLSETNQGLLISSNDNFVYLISKKNGEKIWKRRFANRTATFVDKTPGSPAVAVNLNSAVAALLDPETGKIINQIALPDSVFFVGKPLFINGTIVFTTNYGLTSYSANSDCSKNRRPEARSGL